MGRASPQRWRRDPGVALRAGSEVEPSGQGQPQLQSEVKASLGRLTPVFTLLHSSLVSTCFLPGSVVCVLNFILLFFWFICYKCPEGSVVVVFFLSQK